jgi:N6-adenosine-specific RNA methylase IME4/transposase-like protein
LPSSHLPVLTWWMIAPPETPIKCPVCHSVNTVKNGTHAPTRSQKIRCKDCGRHFRSRYKHHARKTSIQRQLTQSLNAGASIRQTAFAYGVASATVQRQQQKLQRELQNRTTHSPPPLPAGTKFSTILADPAWSFDNYSQANTARTPQSHYDVMTVEEICALPVEAVAAQDCMLFLWAVSPRLPDAIRVGEAWGFEYKTVAFTWVKEVAKGGRVRRLPVAHPLNWHMGMGYYTRANPELCLLFTRGNPKRLSKAVRQLVIAPVREHSRKPDEIYTHIEALTTAPYLELFARQAQPGWIALGNEIDGQSLSQSLVGLAQ